MCLWCAFNAVCSSGHLPEKALGEHVCVYARKCMQLAAFPGRDQYLHGQPMTLPFTVPVSFPYRKRWGWRFCLALLLAKGLVMSKLKQGLLVNRKISCTYYDPSTAHTVNFQSHFQLMFLKSENKASERLFFIYTCRKRQIHVCDVLNLLLVYFTCFLVILTCIVSAYNLSSKCCKTEL